MHSYHKMVVQIRKTAARQRDVGQYPEYGRAAIVPISVVVVCFAAILWQPCNKVHGHCMVIGQQSYGIARQICRCKLLLSCKNIMRALQQPGCLVADFCPPKIAEILQRK